ncbi:MAG: DUF1365 domain-containing protein [Acidobacteriota bacterium]
MNLEPGIYTGTLRHRRFEPTRHEFSYPVFMAFLNIDIIPETMRRSAISSYNRFNWASFHESDHFGDSNDSLRQRLRHDAALNGITLPRGPIYLLTNLRYFGYCFNPISLYYCYEPDSTSPPVVMAEVNSTFGESKNYWLGPHNAKPSRKALHFQCAKELHVSPFMAMPLEYQFVLTPPDEALMVHMNTLDAGHSFFDATLTLQRQPWTAASLTRTLLRFPFITAKVIAAIHWQALRLWWKGTPVHTHPARRSPATGEVPHP